jgi:4-amino-4-deoxy-L-arabinose transferase-like glycosyltransferase
LSTFKEIPGKEKKIVFLILTFALILKIIFVFALSADIRSDSMVYDSIAKNIIKLGEYSFEGKPTATLSCGYPLFVAAIYKIFGASDLWVRLIQSILEVFTGFLFFLISLEFFKVKWSIVSLAIFTFLPSNLIFSQTILTEPLFGLLACILLYYCLRENIDSKIFFIGLVWGYAVLVRSSFSISLALLPLFLFINRRKLFEGFKQKRIKRVIQYTFLFVLGAVIVILPWLVRNKITMNTFTIATQGGFTFWSGSNPDATGTWYYKIEDSNPLFKIEDEATRDREFYILGLDYAIHNPHKFLVTGIKKLGYLFSSERLILLYFTKADSTGKTSTEVYKSINPFWIALFNIPYMIIMLFGIWGLLALKKKRFFIYGFIFTWMLTFFIFVALARYHYVLIPFFVIGTIKLISEYRTIFRELNIPKKIIGVCFSLFLIVVWTGEFYLLYK